MKPESTLADVLEFSTFIGGSGADEINCVVFDDDGNMYVAGVAQSADLPSSGLAGIPYTGANDYFVMKINNESEIVYTTYIGGTEHEGLPSIHPDYNCWIDVDDSGRVYMTGYTYSADFPLANAWDASYGGQADCFALRLSSSGDTIEYSTYFGGWRDEMATSIAVDGFGNAYITGWTESIDFPTLGSFDDTLGGTKDAFILKFDPSGQLSYSSYLGGSENEHSHPCGLVINENGTAYIAGRTYSSDFPLLNPYDEAYNGAGDVFFTQVNSTGHLISSSFFGGTNLDSTGGIAIDLYGNIYVSGQGSPDFPITNVLSDNPSVFIAKFNPSGQNLIYSATFGGTNGDNPSDLEVDSEGCAFITGHTYSDNFPTVNAYDATWNGGADTYILKLSSQGDSIFFSSYFGGSGDDVGLSLVKNEDGRVFLAGGTDSSNFPIISPIDSTQQNLEGFILRVEDTYHVPPTTSTTTTTTTSTSNTTSVIPGTTSFAVLIVSDLDIFLIVGIAIEIVIIVTFVTRRQRQPK
jgi:hypothetical protein